MSYLLKVISGPNTGQTVPLTPGQVHVIGRGAEAHLAIVADQTLSRAHAEVFEQGGQWFVRNKSQHGTLFGGVVFHDQRPLTHGAQFQAGASQIQFEGAGAMAGAAPAAMPGAAPAAAGAAPAAAGAAPAAGGGFGGGLGGMGGFGDALGGGGAFALPAEYTGHSGPGFPFKAILKGGIGVYKANLVPSLVAMVAMAIPLVGVAVMFNYMGMIKRFVAEGTPVEIGGLFKFDDFVNRLLLVISMGIVAMIGGCCFGIPGLMLGFAVPILVDKPGTPFVSCLKAAFAWTKTNMVGNLIQVFLLGLLLALPFVAVAIVSTVLAVVIALLPPAIGGIIMLVVSLVMSLVMFLYSPVPSCGMYLAYNLKRPEIEAAAAEAGVDLA